MKSVYIFGAGASRNAGGPLMSDFFDKAERLLRTGNAGDAEDDFKDVFKVLAELQSLHAKSAFDLDNLETVFGAIEMGQLIQKLAKRTPTSIAKLRKAMVVLIVKTLEQSMPFPVKNGRIIAPRPYERFAELLKTFTSPTNDRDYSLITFNYDIALDYSLFSQKIKYDYCLADAVSNNRDKVPLLKLHGSINWGVCDGCHATLPYYIEEFHQPNFGQMFIGDDVPNAWKLELGSELKRRSHQSDPKCSHAYSPVPLIVPPTWDKTSGHAKLGNVWKRAAKELESAENIFVVGYSLPESDLFFRYLFSLGLEGDTRIKKFWVFDPDRATVEPRFKRLIGRGLENRFQFHDKKFEESLGEIKQALESY